MDIVASTSWEDQELFKKYAKKYGTVTAIFLAASATIVAVIKTVMKA